MRSETGVSFIIQWNWFDFARNVLCSVQKKPPPFRAMQHYEIEMQQLKLRLDIV